MSELFDNKRNGLIMRAGGIHSLDNQLSPVHIEVICSTASI